ncbi:MAG: CAP domain-containing protein, partial [Minisyncoccia bacterium]
RYVLPSETFLASVLPAALLDLTNQDRVAVGDAPVVENPLLDQAARAAAQDMASKGYFAHVSPSGQTPWNWLDQVNYKYLYAGENLAVNFSDSNAVEEAWMASPTHHTNIVKPQYTEVGFGTAEGVYEGQETTFVVTFFGTPISASSVSVALAPTTSKAPVAIAASAPIVQAAPLPASSSVLAASTPAPSPVSVFTLALASPVSTATTAAAALIALVAALMAIGVIMRRRIPHAQVLAGGMALIVLASAAILFDRDVAGQVLLPSDTQGASVVSALAP